MSLNCHYYDYRAVISIYKHVIELKLTFKKYFCTDFKLFEFVASQVPAEEPFVIIFNLKDANS